MTAPMDPFWLGDMGDKPPLAACGFCADTGLIPCDDGGEAFCACPAGMAMLEKARAERPGDYFGDIEA